MRSAFISTVLLLAGLLLLALSTSLEASDGKTIFIKKCGSCHRGGGEAAAFAPTKYASTQWERFFARNKHKRKKDISADYTPAQLDLVKKYLVSHAADSDQPEAVGLK